MKSKTKLVHLKKVSSFLFALLMAGLGAKGAWQQDEKGNALIGTVSDLVCLQEWVAAGSNTVGMTFLQTADIDLGSLVWAGIGSRDQKDNVSSGGTMPRAFRGTYDGQNHKIENVKLLAGDYDGFFNSIHQATIRNLKITIREHGIDTDTCDQGARTDHTMAVFVGVMKESTLQNLETIRGETDGAREFASYKDAAGIVGLMVDGLVEDCRNNLDITFGTANDRKGGGIVLLTQAGGGDSRGATIRGCVNTGRIRCNTCAMNGIGGILGLQMTSTVIEDCANSGELEVATPNGSMIGTIVGAVRNSGSLTVVPMSNRAQDSVFSSGNPVDGLNFAMVMDGVATFVPVTALAAGNVYKVMTDIPTNSFHFSSPGMIAFDCALNPSFAATVTATNTLKVAQVVNGDVTAYLASSRYQPSWIHSVAFCLGCEGERAGGGSLLQSVTNGFAAVAPEIVPHDGWSFTGWSRDFSSVVTDMVVFAEYVRKPFWYGIERVDGIDWRYCVSNGVAEVTAADVFGGSTSTPAISPSITRVISVPATLGGCPVVSIGECALVGSAASAITLPEGVVNISQAAFASCEAESVELPASLRVIGRYAFTEMHNLREIVIPDLVQEIDIGICQGCSSLVDVTIGRGVRTTSTMSFGDCGALTNLTILSSELTIGIESFASSGFESLEVPGEVKAIDFAAFNYSPNLTYLIVGEGVESIRQAAFTGCPLEYVSVAASVTNLEMGAFCNCNQTTRFDFLGDVPRNLVADSRDPIMDADAQIYVTHAYSSAWQTYLAAHGMGIAGYLDDEPAPQSTAWYVDSATGADGHDGRSAAMAFSSIQRAVDAAGSNDVIYVAAGTYGPIVTSNKCVRIVGVEGAEKTIIDGGGTTRCVTVTYSTSTTYGTDQTNTCLVGFTLRNGYADLRGAGIYGGSLSDGLVQQCVVAKGGGACYGTCLSDCVIASNRCIEGWGGGCSWCVARRCRIFANSADYGGGMDGGEAYDCRIENNRAAISGGGVASSYGTFYRCLIAGNVATTNAGGAYCGNLVNCMVVSNRSLIWGAAGTMGASLRNCTVVGNAAPKNYCAGVIDGTMVNSIAWDNVDLQGSPGQNVHASVVASYSCAPELLPTNGCIRANPRLVQREDGVFVLGRLSPCIDACPDESWPVPDSDCQNCDFDGHARRVASCIDMGAVEFQDADDVATWKKLDVASDFAVTADFASPPIGRTYFESSNAVTASVWLGIVYGSDVWLRSCIGWRGTGSVPPSGTSNSVSFILSQNSSITWLWGPTNFLLRISAPQNGRIEGGTTGWMPVGTQTVLSAVPDQGYEFLYWTGNTNGCQVVGPTIRVIMDETRSIGAVFGGAPPDVGREWFVSATSGSDGYGGGDDAPFATIQWAVDAAGSNDVIYVAAGTYGPIVTSNKCVRIVGVEGAEKTIIDGGGTRRCAELSNGFVAENNPMGVGSRGRNTVLEGFTLRNGFAGEQIGYQSLEGCGGGVTGGTLVNCVVENCRASAGGGVFYSDLTNTVVRGCSGGGVFGGNLVGCLIAQNRIDGYGDGAGCGFVGDVVGCTIVGNRLGCSNDMGESAGIGSAVSVVDCIVWDNRADVQRVASTGGTETNALNNFGLWHGDRYCRVCTFPVLQGGVRCITNDPCFVDAANSDFRLGMDSPCIDKGATNSLLTTDLRGATRIVNGYMDLGAYEWQPGETNLPVVARSTVSIDGLETRTLNAGDTFRYELEPQVNGGTQFVASAWTVWRGQTLLTNGTDEVISFVAQAPEGYRIAIDWQTNFWFEATTNAAGGTVRAPDTGWYPCGTNLLAVAVPDAHCELQGWLGTTNGCSALGNELAIPLSQARSIRARFGAEMFRVIFEIGEHARRTGGGALEQMVEYDQSAVAPSLKMDTGWVFTGWQGSYDHVESNVTVQATSRPSYPDLFVASVAPLSSVRSGDTAAFAWKVANRGNSAFNGTMTERVILVSVDDASVSNVVGEVRAKVSVPADGVVDRQLDVAFPLKGLVGRWQVLVVTAMSPTVHEFGGDNSGLSGAVLEVEAVPLPDLRVANVSIGQTLIPGEEATVAFRLDNAGTATAVAPWIDAVYLESAETGSSVKMAAVARAEDLDANDGMNESIAFAIPETIALAGSVRVKVVADMDDRIVEVDDDNVVWGEQTVMLATNLYLVASSTSVKENYTSRLRFTVKRSGPTDAAMTVNLAVDAEGQLVCPETVTIPAHNASTAFYVETVDNTRVDGNRVVAITASCATCRPARTELTIVDDEVPHLFVTLDRSSIREGDGAVLATVTREIVTDADLTVNLSGVSSTHCTYPSSVVIPAGESTVTFEILPVDNATAEVAAVLTLKASSSGYAAGSVTYELEDDDVPGVTLSVTPEVVSEGAGSQAIYATLTRSDTAQIAKAIRVNLAASEQNQLILPSQVTIPARTMSVRFAVGVVDNALDDGDREVEITGAVVIESCGCSGQPSNGDVIQALVGICDNDGPALTLTAEPTTMKEGLDEAGWLILSHNSVLTEDMEVQLSYELEGELEIPSTAVIPAGEKSVRIPVRTLDDGEEDGGRLVSIYADDVSGTFSSASAWVQVSDQNLPDLIVEDVTPAAQTVVGEDTLDVTFGVRNVGFRDRGDPVLCNVYFVRGDSVSLGDAELAATVTTRGGISVGETRSVSARLTAPSFPGSYRIAVVADPEWAVSELDDANNTGWSSSLSVTPSYIAVVAPRKNVYLQGERVFLDGQAYLPDGATPAVGRKVEVYVLNNPYRRIYTVTSDSEGRFMAEFLPVSGEGGHYSVGASYPGISATAEQGTFDILGLKRTSTSNLIFDLTVGTQKEVSVPVRNLSSIPLTGVLPDLPQLPPECGVEVQAPEGIDGNGVANVLVRVTGTSVTPADVSGYRKIPVTFTTDEGVSLSFPIYVVIREPQAQVSLKFSPPSLSAKMTVGETRYVEATLTNMGSDPSGAIALNVPTATWLKAMNGSTINSLAPGESTTVSLELSPSDALTLNAPIKGTIQARETEMGAIANLSFSFTPVSDRTGVLNVTPVDEYTYYNAGEPHVTNASVTVKNPYSGAVVASGNTGPDGVWLSPELPTGVYTVSITAPQHSSWSQKVAVEPGETTVVDPFLSFTAVTYSWDVKRVEIEDAYEVTLVADFVTSVPKPTVVLEVPKQIPKLNEGESHVFNITAVNHGLISALNVSFSFPTDFPYEYEFASGVVDEIPAKSSVTIPVRISFPDRNRPTLQSTSRISSMTLQANATPPQPGELDANACSYGIMAMFEYLCGPEIRRAVARSSALQVSGMACDALVTIINRLAELFPTPDVQTRDPVPGSNPEPPGWDHELYELPGYSEEYMRSHCLMALKLIECLLDKSLLRNFKFTKSLGTWIAYQRYGEATRDEVYEAFGDDISAIMEEQLQELDNEVASRILNEEDLEIYNQADEWRERFDNCRELFETEEEDGEAVFSDPCMEAVRYYLLVYRQARAAELERLRRERQAEQQEAVLQSAALQGDESDAVERLNGQCEPEIQDDAAIATAGLMDTLVEREKLIYLLGDDAWRNERAIFAFPLYIHRAIASSLSADSGSDLLVAWNEDEVAVLMKFLDVCTSVDENDILQFVARWNRTAELWNQGIFTKEQLPEGNDVDFIDADELNSYQETIAQLNDIAVVQGKGTLAESVPDALRHLQVYFNENADAVCARVSMKFNQTVCVAREAFEGTLTMFNGHATRSMTDISLSVTVTDEEGDVCTDLFGITENGLQTFSGTSIRAGGVALGPSSTGFASILFVPTPAAAPDGPKLYYFGGTLAYTDPFTGERITVPLSPVALIVNPCPQLDLHYFLQQEVFGDDPLTPDVVEPSEPTELALLVVNKGAGAVRNLTVRAAQPEKFVNEKGLAVDFRLSDYLFTGATVNGVSGGGVTTTDLGGVPSKGAVQAQWWLTSSLQGRFVGMKADFTQVNDWGNEETSLIDSVKIHALIRSVDADENGKPDYLVEDEMGVEGIKSLFLDSGVAHDVRAAAAEVSGHPNGSSFSATVSFSADDAGAWYAVVDDPGAGRYDVAEVIRADGSTVPARNVWQRDRSIGETGVPDYADKLHLFDVVSESGAQTYTVRFVARQTDMPEVFAFHGVDNPVEYSVRNEVEVEFASEIDPSTFTGEDVSLLVQGMSVDVSSRLSISPLDESGRRYAISGLASLCDEYGRYELTVQCAGISSLNGAAGVGGKSVVWTFAEAASPYIITLEGVPEQAVRQFDSLVVVVSAEVSVESVRQARKTLNDLDVTERLTVRSCDVGGTRFELTGLESLQSEDGSYEFAIDGSGLRTPGGVAGIGVFSATWRRDATSPVLVKVEKHEEMGECRFLLQFTEDIALPTLLSGHVSLVRDRLPLELAGPIALLPLGEGLYALTGIGSEIRADGAYSFTFDSAGVTDAAGNVASGTMSVSWTVDTTPPDGPNNLATSSDYGLVDTVVYVSEGSMTVSGTVPEPGVDVQLLCRYAGGADMLLARPAVDVNGAFSAEVTLPETGGNLTFVIRLTDAAGNFSDTEMKTYYDKIALTAELSGAPEMHVPASRLTLAFSDAVVAEDVSLDRFELLRNHQPVSLDGVALSADPDGRTFALEGLEDLCSEDGDYELAFSSTDVRKRLSGLKASACAPLAWRYEHPDCEPPAIIDVVVDGEPLREIYTNGISSVRIVFNESVNVPELMLQGLGAQLVKVLLTDAQGDVTGVVHAVSSDLVWDAASSALTWEPARVIVGPGHGRIVVDAGLIADLAGNRLAAGEPQVDLGLQTFGFALEAEVQAHSYAMPTWYDLDGDGLGDLLVGEKGADGMGRIRFFRNRGTAAAPSFDGYSYLQVGEEDLVVEATGCQGVQVAFADLTGDGRDDLIVGRSSGAVQMFRGCETGGRYSEGRCLWHGTEAVYGSERAFACPFDFDGDGVAELVIGGLDGRFRQLKLRDGQVVEVSWLTDAAGVPLKVAAGRSTPIFADVNGDGCVDILSGDTEGNVWAFLGEGRVWNSAAIPLFVNDARLPDRSRLGFADVDCDGVGDLLIGRSDGSVAFARGFATPCPSFAVRVKGTCLVTFDLGEFATMESGRLVQSVVEDDAAVAPVIAVDDCHVFTGWDVAFDRVQEDVVVHATYVHKPPVTLAVDGVQEAAEASASHGNGCYEIVYGDEVVVAVPSSATNAGMQVWSCSGWTGTGCVPLSGEACSFAVRMTADSSVTWNWRVSQWWLETGAEHGTVDVPSGWQSANASVPVTAVPDAHYVFERWSGDVEDCVAEGRTLMVAMDRRRAIKAEFELQRHTVSTGAGEMIETDPPAGALEGYAYGSMVTVEVVNAVWYAGATQFVCTGWAADNAEPSTGRGPQAVFRVEGDVDLEWLWQTNVLTLAESIEATNLVVRTGGAGDWEPVWSLDAADGKRCARSGLVGHNLSTWIEVEVDGAGELSFVWKCSTESRYDMCQLIIDDVVKGSISGETAWSTNVVALGDGVHVVRWNYRKSRSGTDGADAVWLDCVSWKPDVPPSLAEALNTELHWTTEGDVEWQTRRRSSILDPRESWAEVNGLGDFGISSVETMVYGAGVISFDWAVSCEEEYDWFDLIVDGELRGTITGTHDWEPFELEIPEERLHVIRWEYWKDDLDDPELAGDNLAMLDNVVWKSALSNLEHTVTTGAPVPFSVIQTAYPSYLQKAGGNYENAAWMKGLNGRPIWESYVIGLDPDKPDERDLTAMIEVVDGVPRVTWSPDLNENGTRRERVYRTWGVKALGPEEVWKNVDSMAPAEKGGYRFFKVTVELP